MTEGKHTLDESAMLRIGRRLQDARLAMGYSPGGLAPLLMAARTQIEDLEAGRMGTFYSAHYYLALFQRYAAYLKFSPAVVAEMVRELKGDQAVSPLVSTESPPSEPVDLPCSPADSSLGSPVNSPPDSPVDSTVDSPVDSAPPSTAPPEESAPSGLGDRLLVTLALLAVVVVAWVLLSEPGMKDPPSASAPAPTAQATTASAPAAPAPAPAAQAPAPAAPAPAAPTQAVPAPAPAPAPAAPTPAAPAGALASGPDALVLRFPEKSWIWVRRADDSVSEVGVAAGSTLRFAEMPIYVVLPRPSEVQVTVRGREARLNRNDGERDMGRFTRTMLEESGTR